MWIQFLAVKCPSSLSLASVVTANASFFFGRLGHWIGVSMCVCVIKFICESNDQLSNDRLKEWWNGVIGSFWSGGRIVTQNGSVVRIVAVNSVNWIER